MDCPRLNEPGYPEMGCSQTSWLGFGLRRLGLEQLCESTLDELILGLTIEPSRASTVNVPFGHDEQRHDACPSGRHVDGYTAAHAVTHQAAVTEVQSVDERDDGSCVILESIAEVEWFVAVPVAEEVDQQRSAAP